MKKLWVAIVKLLGWKYNNPAPGSRPEIEHCVIVVAPHTSILDFLIGATCLWELGVNARIFMKKEFFNPISRPVLNHFGVVPVDRGNRANHLVQQAVDYFNANDRFALTITPEATRKKVHRWKRGFYEIAHQANVPLVLAYVDYKTKTMGIGPTIYPSGDYPADLAKMADFYRNIHARHPEKYDPNPRP